VAYEAYDGHDEQAGGCVYLPDPAAPMRFHTCQPVQRSGPVAPPFPRPEAPARRPQAGAQYPSFERIVAGFVG
jgi:hypothetical protein